MAESIDHITRGPRIAQARAAVRHARPVAEPHTDPLGRQILRQFRKHADQMIAQDLGASPVGRGLEPRELHLARGAQAVVLPVHHHLGIGRHDGGARTGFRIHDHDVIAALGLERQAIADRCREWLRMRAGGDHHGVAGDLAPLGEDRHRLAALQPQARGLRRDELRTERAGVRGECCDITAGIPTTARFLDQHTELVTRIELRLALAHLVGGQLHPGHADALADTPAEGVGVERRARRVDVHEPLAFDQMADPRLVGELPVQGRRIEQQRAQGARRRLHPRFGPAGKQISREPGQHFWQIAPAHRQRTQRVSQHLRHFFPGARLGRWNHRMRRQPAGIAVARRLFAAGRRRFDDRDAMTVTQQLDGAGHADGAGSDHSDVAAGRFAHDAAASVGTKSLAWDCARGSSRQCRIAGWPEASARSNASAKSAVRSTRSP